MIIAKLAIAALLMFGAVSVAGAMGIVLALLFGPRDPYDEALEDREQLEYIERWRDRNETEA
jgi:hypothetical protein